jgi:hypothetical protein
MKISDHRFFDIAVSSSWRTPIERHQEIADAYVVMRLAELVCEQRIGAVIDVSHFRNSPSLKRN